MMGSSAGGARRIQRIFAAASFCIALGGIDNVSLAEFERIVCSFENVEREIQVVSPGREGQGRLCEVYYMDGDSSSRVLWHAHYIQQFCIVRAEQLKARLVGNGWACSDPVTLKEPKSQIVETAITNTLAEQNVEESNHEGLASQSDAVMRAPSGSKTTMDTERDGDDNGGLSGYASVSYQHIKLDGFLGSEGFLGTGEVFTHSVYAEVGLNITDRLTAVVGLPWITKRYGGGFFAHNPDFFDPPKDSEFLDDGNYHGDFQDFRASLHYRLTDGPLVVEPFVSIGVPTHDYPFFGEAAVGQRLFRFAVGGRFTYQPHFEDYYITSSIARGFTDPPFDINVNHWLLDFEAGYFLTPRFSVRGLVQAKQGNGLEFPRDFPVLVPPFDELIYQHDRLLKLNFVNVGGGFSYNVGDKGRNRISINAMRMVRGVAGLKMEYSLTVGFSRSF